MTDSTAPKNNAQLGLRKLTGLLVGLLVLSAIVVVLIQTISGIRVRVKNNGTKPIRSVTLEVGGRLYPAGDVGTGNFVEVKVRPSGTSGLRIDFTDADGERKQVYVDCCLERGYRGFIEVPIKDGVVEKNNVRIQVR